MALFRRYATALMLALWMGGFTYYALIVIPTATAVLGNERPVGFITRRVTYWLNWIGMAAMLVFLWNALAEFKRQPPRRRKWLAISLLVMAGAHAGLVLVHAMMNRLLEPAGFKIHEYDRFEHRHDAYLVLATTQWVAALLYTWLSFASWQFDDVKAGAETRGG